MTLAAAQGIKLTLTVSEAKSTKFRSQGLFSDGLYGSSFSGPGMSNLPMTVSEDRRSVSSGEGKRFRLKWGGNSDGGVDVEIKRQEKEREAEEFISSLSGRSLTIQRSLLDKALAKEKRRIKFGLSSTKVMELALRRYSFKLSELDRDIQLEREFQKCPEEFGFVLRHFANRLDLPSDCHRFRKMYWDVHGRHLNLTRIMFDDQTDMARKRQLVLERIPRKKLHPENSHIWWDEDAEGNRIPSRDHVEWICWGFTPSVEEVSKICERIARRQPPDLETVRLYRAQAILAA